MLFRSALAKMLTRPAALLCLDEPTNHLDLVSREVLEAALAAFPGTIVFISHDRYFINRIATSIIEVSDGQLVTYLGDYDDYLVAKARLADPSASGDSAAPRTAALDETPVPRSRPKPRVSREVLDLRRRLDDVERQIHALEERLTGLGQALGDPALYADGERARAVARERQEAEEQVAWLMREWEALSTELATHE